jgi:hypothetical protein
MDTETLKIVLEKHRKWMFDEAGGERANLSGVDLSGANLRSADLRSADLRSADLSGADLSGANLRSANLSGVDLSGANLSGVDLSGADLKDTLLDNIVWLSYVGIIPCPDGTAYAYKIINSEGEGIYKGGINYLADKKISVHDCDTDVNEQCGRGINLATFQWCLSNGNPKEHRILLMKFKTADAICPIASDGKFRVSACERVGEIDWKGNLIKAEGK